MSNLTISRVFADALASIDTKTYVDTVISPDPVYIYTGLALKGLKCGFMAIVSKYRSLKSLYQNYII